MSAKRRAARARSPLRLSRSRTLVFTFLLDTVLKFKEMVHNWRVGKKWKVLLQDQFNRLLQMVQFARIMYQGHKHLCLIHFWGVPFSHFLPLLFPSLLFLQYKEMEAE